jgi:hypothetical protein
MQSALLALFSQILDNVYQFQGLVVILVLDMCILYTLYGLKFAIIVRDRRKLTVTSICSWHNILVIRYYYPFSSS